MNTMDTPAMVQARSTAITEPMSTRAVTAAPKAMCQPRSEVMKCMFASP